MMTIFRLLILSLALLPQWAIAATPIATDSRIRTFVYGENEVYKVISQYGYQSNVEFGAKEEITTISLGDTVAWKVTPAGNRLFIKALKEGAKTNLTVVTNQHAYQFELSSAVSKDEDIIYVVRFYYPDKDFDGRRRSPSDNDGNVAGDDGTMFSRMLGGKQQNAFRTGGLVEAQYNFNYSLTGPTTIAPVKVFDDGQFTFFSFPEGSTAIPTFYSVNPDGTEAPLVSRQDGEYIVVERVMPQFSLRRGPDVVCVFNDNLIVPPERLNQPLKP